MVIKSGIEMDGVCAISRMAYKAMLEFPMKPGVCVFGLWEKSTWKKPHGGEHATSTKRSEPDENLVIAMPFCHHGL